MFCFNLMTRTIIPVCVHEKPSAFSVEANFLPLQGGRSDWLRTTTKPAQLTARSISVSVKQTKLVLERLYAMPQIKVHGASGLGLNFILKCNLEMLTFINYS